MSEWFKVLLSLSLSGSLLLVAVLLLCRLLRDRVSKRWQFYIWLVVIARLLIPLSPPWSVMNSLLDNTPAPVEQVQADIPSAGEILPDPDGSGGNTAPSRTEAATSPVPDSQPTPDRRVKPIEWGDIAPFLWIPWLVVAIALLIRKITAYQSFTTYIKAGKTEISDPDLLNRFGELCEERGVKRRIELYQNPLAATPLLSGIFRPCIVLPDAGLSDTEFRYIIRHELVHYKRGDLYYKWLAQITLCVHWFNPLVYWMVRELNRACELSCDEAVIRTLDSDGKRAYGDTLLESLKTPGSYKPSLASITLNETVSQLKERLASIMNYKEKPAWLVAGSITLAFLLCVGSFFLGSYSTRVSLENSMASMAEEMSRMEQEYWQEYGKGSEYWQEYGKEVASSSAESAPSGQSGSGGASSPASLAGAFTKVDGTVDSIQVMTACGMVEFQTGEEISIAVTPKLEEHIFWEVSDGTLNIYDNFANGVQFNDFRSEEYTIFLTLPDDGKTYESISIRTGFGGVKLDNIKAKTADFNADGTVDITRVQAGKLSFNHDFGTIYIGNCIATGPITYKGSSGVTMEGVTGGSLDMELDFGTATIRECDFTDIFRFRGDATKVFEKINAGTFEVLSEFGATTVDECVVAGKLYHEGDQNVNITGTQAGAMEFKYSFGKVYIRGSMITDGLTLTNLDGGSADIAADITGDIILNVGDFGDITVHNTGAKREQYAVEATGFSYHDQFSNTGYVIDGRTYNSDYTYSPSAPYKLGIYSNRDFGISATVNFVG